MFIRFNARRAKRCSPPKRERRLMPDAPEIDLADFDWTDWADDPFPLYRQLRDEAPVYSDERNQTYVLTRHDDVYRILLDHRGYSSVPLDILEGRQPPTSEIRQQDEPRHGFIRIDRVAALHARCHAPPRGDHPGDRPRHRRCGRGRRRGRGLDRDRDPAPRHRRTRADRPPAGASRQVRRADGRAARVPAHPRQPRRELARGARAASPASAPGCGRSSSR